MLRPPEVDLLIGVAVTPPLLLGNRALFKKRFISRRPEHIAQSGALRLALLFEIIQKHCLLHGAGGDFDRLPRGTGIV